MFVLERVTDRMPIMSTKQQHNAVKCNSSQQKLPTSAQTKMISVL